MVCQQCYLEQQFCVSFFGLEDGRTPNPDSPQLPSGASGAAAGGYEIGARIPLDTVATTERRSMERRYLQLLLHSLCERGEG